MCFVDINPNVFRRYKSCFLLFCFTRNLFPDNLFEASFSKAQTMFRENKKHVVRNTTNGTVTETVVTMTKYVGQADGTNLLGICEHWHVIQNN